MNTISTFFRLLKCACCLVVTVVFTFVSCESEPSIAPDDDSDDEELVAPEEAYDPFVITDGKVRFYLRDGSILSAYGAKITDWSAYTVEVNGTAYAVSVNEEGKSYIDVPVSNTSTVYNAVVTSKASAPYHGETKYDGLLRPHSYIHHKAAEMVASYPMYASYSLETGGTLEFTNGMAALKLKVKGNGESVASIKVENLGGGFVAGQGTYSPTAGLSLSKGLYFTVLNTTANGSFVQLSPDGTHFLVPLPARSYTNGFEITLCTSDHKMSKVRTGALHFEEDGIYDFEFEHRPDADLLFYEGFDNFVWGGDLVGGSSTFALNPAKGASVTTSTGKLWNGYDPAVLPVAYDVPGIGYVQSTTYANIMNKTVGTASVLHSSYVKSRNIADYLYMYRCQERQGYISIGDNEAYGEFEAPFMEKITLSHQDIKVSFRYSPNSGFNNPIRITATGGANIVRCTVNGSTSKVTRSFKVCDSECIIAADAVTVPSDMSAYKLWNTVELTIKNVNNKSAIRIACQNSEAGKVSSFCFDDFCVRRLADHTVHTDKLRVLYWNIQYGMWADQGSNYDNFVRFIKKYDPDICVWCESESYYNNTGTSDNQSGERGYLPKNWSSLASRYGHSYVGRAKNKNNFSQTMTSRFPITMTHEIAGSSSQPLTHGAGLFRVAYPGNDVYVLSLHLKPDQTADNDRKNEIDYLCETIINNADIRRNNDNLTNLLMMGDFNAVSTADKWYYDALGNKSVVTIDNYLPLTHLESETDLIDIMAKQYPGDFYSSIEANNRRIDFMFASPSMYGKVSNATFIVDDWTILTRDASATANTYLCRPSDHRPILVDFKF